jgi:hypothetical protein
MDSGFTDLDITLGYGRTVHIRAMRQSDEAELLLAPLLGLLPNATLAAVIIVYAVGLIQPVERAGIPAGRARRTRDRDAKALTC